MKRGSVLDHQSVKRDRLKGFLHFKRTLGQLGFGLIKTFLFLLVLGGLSLAFVSTYHFLSSSPYLRLQKIIVTGVNDDLREELIKISGITQRQNLLSLNLAAIKRNIERHPWIKSVFLKKEFPHTLIIKVENEEAVAIVLLKEKMYLMDSEGVMFKEAARDDYIDFPVVTGLSTGDKKDGEYLTRVASFLEALYLWDTPLSIKELSEVYVEEDGDLTTYFDRLPFKVFFGRDDFGRKIDSLRHIIKHLRSTHRLYQARSIDLDYSDKAIVAFTDKVV
jgi:cell division protein FtsQ